MKYFIVTFRKENEKPVVNKISGYYDLKTLFNAMETLYVDKIPFSVYNAECIGDFS